MQGNKTNRMRRYIRITDAEQWRLIDALMRLPAYKSFNKVIGGALFYGLPILYEKVTGDMLTQEERAALTEPRQGTREEELRALIVRLLQETVLNVVINRSVLSSLFELAAEQLDGTPRGELLRAGRLSDTPDYLSQYEAEGIRALRRSH